MHVVVGLGNPGPTYQKTRHNLGWMVLEHAAVRWGISFTQKGQTLQGQGQIGTSPVLLALPLTWMNQTGEVVRALLQDQNRQSTDLILVYDDLDLPLGSLKIKTRGSAGGHNGLRSVLFHLETENFCRLKVGIGRPSDEDPAHYVLSAFTPEEHLSVDVLLPRAVDALECIMVQGIPEAMNRFHAPPLPKDTDGQPN